MSINNTPRAVPEGSPKRCGACRVPAVGLPCSGLPSRDVGPDGNGLGGTGGLALLPDVLDPVVDIN